MSSDPPRILTTHVGSLPRAADVLQYLVKKENGAVLQETGEEAAFRCSLSAAVRDVVARQVQLGLDWVNDGEMSKFAYSTYVTERLSGFAGHEKGKAPSDVLDFPEYAKRSGGLPVKRPLCQGPVAVKDTVPLAADLANFRRAVDAAQPVRTFLTAASPGLAAYFLQNRYYPTHDAYLAALAEALRPEYEAIIAAGFDLQLDCPDLAMGRHIRYADDSDAQFRVRSEAAVAALNHATANIAPERMRLHLCWGNYSGPHHRDMPLAQVLSVALKARPAAFSFEGANPRHDHEWEVFSALRLPEDKLVLPGVIDSTTNFIEHPRLVAQRIERYAGVVGRERVIASTDCGFATSAHSDGVDPAIAWAKLGVLVEGARLASQRLWKS